MILAELLRGHDPTGEHRLDLLARIAGFGQDLSSVLTCPWNRPAQAKTMAVHFER